MDKPTPPDQIPNYVADGLARQDSETLREIIAYAQRLIEYNDWKETQIDYEGEGEEVQDVEETEDGAIVIKKVPCGKDSCSSCPHGPYKYVVTYSGGTANWEYKGPANGE